MKNYAQDSETKLYHLLGPSKWETSKAGVAQVGNDKTKMIEIHILFLLVTFYYNL